jgi:hypothetical protein
MKRQNQYGAGTAATLRRAAAHGVPDAIRELSSRTNGDGTTSVG